MVVLNLGCGSRTSPQCVNVDWSPYLRLKRNPLGARIAPILLRGERRQRFSALADSIVVHDLRKGVPGGDSSVDAVYHSHVLEHLDRDRVDPFLAEILRVLRPDGVHRVVVPDLERLCRAYLSHLDAHLENPRPVEDDHDAHVGAMIEQLVRREPGGTSQQRPLQRRLENLLLGDARRRGETHQWMWDRVNLSVALRQAGFDDIRIVDYRTSAVPGWNSIRLDEMEDGTEYIPGSLYVESRK